VFAETRTDQGQTEENNANSRRKQRRKCVGVCTSFINAKQSDASDAKRRDNKSPRRHYAPGILAILAQ